jgi:hypothetical protein
MQLLKQSTAATVVVGPFVDDTDGKTAETGLTISQADIRLSKNGGAFAQSNDASGATHMEDGYYGVPLDATDTNTLGRLTVAVSEGGALPVYREFMVVPANVHDSLVAGTDTLEADLTQMGGTAQSATDLKDFADSGYDPSTHKVETVKTADTCATNTDMRGTDNALLAASAPANFGDLAITASSGRVTVGANNDKTGYSVSGAVTDLDTLQSNLRGPLGAGIDLTKLAQKDTGGSYDPDTDSLEALAESSAPTAATIADAVWEEAIADHSGTAGSTAEALGNASSAGDPWGTALPGAYGAGTAGRILGDNLDAAVSTRSTLTAQGVWEYVNRTLTDFGTLVSDIWSAVARTLTAGTKDAEIDAIKAKTDTVNWPDITDLKDEALGKWVLDHQANTLTLYRTDGVTVLKTFLLEATGDAVPAYITRTPQ